LRRTPQSLKPAQIEVTLEKHCTALKLGKKSMAEAFSPEISDRICKHMNDDHADAVALYARVFGNVPQATAAQMLKIDAEGMDLSAQVNGTPVPVRVAFDHKLVDSEDAHHTLIAMVKQARSQS
jgi:putative heme iron utilization protein